MRKHNPVSVKTPTYVIEILGKLFQFEVRVVITSEQDFSTIAPK